MQVPLQFKFSRFNFNSSPSLHNPCEMDPKCLFAPSLRQKGAFSVAAKIGVPVVPITLIGTGKIMPAGMEGQLNPGTVKVVIHQPIEGDSPDALCSQARDVIADGLFVKVKGFAAVDLPISESL